MAHAINPALKRPAIWVTGQPVLHKETLFRKIKQANQQQQQQQKKNQNFFGTKEMALWVTCHLLPTWV